MKKTSLLAGLMTAVVIILVAPFNLAADEHKKAGDVTMAEFLKMPVDKRLEVCAMHVDSKQLGRCVNLTLEDKGITGLPNSWSRR